MEERFGTGISRNIGTGADRMRQPTAQRTTGDNGAGSKAVYALWMRSRKAVPSISVYFPIRIRLVMDERPSIRDMMYIMQRRLGEDLGVDVNFVSTEVNRRRVSADR